MCIPLLGAVKTRGAAKQLSFPERIPQGLKPLSFPALFGTTEVVPFHETVYETSSSQLSS
jgi:hypothetical protein